MWIFLKDSFLSIVDKGGDGTTLLVRGRCRGDIERVFPNVEVIEGGGTDYGFRARINREEVALVLADSIRSIDYANFKNTVKNRVRHDAYLGVWAQMYRMQGTLGD